MHWNGQRTGTNNTLEGDLVGIREWLGGKRQFNVIPRTMLSRGKTLIDLALKNQNKTKRTKKETVPLFINKPDRKKGMWKNVVANDLNDEMLDVTVEDGEYMFIEERIQGAPVEGSKYKEDSDIESVVF
ncbi:hypothetical protein J6590_008787 [Homalodisca vitripennis]|nr:hypothetical protein J6590_008787 [Homalodisca vitripennis]